MNGSSLCREELKDGRRCGLNYGHGGDHQCCTLHVPRPEFARPADIETWRQE